MSSYRSLHREQVLSTAIWSVAMTPILASNKASSTAANRSTWRILTASGDGLVRWYRATESSLQADVLDASALRLDCTHILLDPKTRDTFDKSIVLGATQVSWIRNYTGDDQDSGDVIVASIDLAGTVRIWNVPEKFDEQQVTRTETENPQPQILVAQFDYNVEDATGTTALLCPPRIDPTNANVTIAVGCLDGTVALVATGVVTPKAKTDAATSAGTIIERWGNQGSAIPLSFCWNPQQHSLIVGRQDGNIDWLTNTRTHRFSPCLHTTPIRAIQFTGDGQLIISGSDEGMVTVWDASRKVLVHHIIQAHQSWIMDIQTFPDSRRFLTAGADDRIQIWNVEQIYQAVHTFQTDFTVYTMDVDNSRLVTGNKQGWLQVYSLEK